MRNPPTEGDRYDAGLRVLRRVQAELACIPELVSAHDPRPDRARLISAREIPASGLTASPSQRTLPQR